MYGAKSSKVYFPKSSTAVKVKASFSANAKIPSPSDFEMQFCVKYLKVPKFLKLLKFPFQDVASHSFLNPIIPEIPEIPSPFDLP